MTLWWPAGELGESEGQMRSPWSTLILIVFIWQVQINSKKKYFDIKLDQIDSIMYHFKITWGQGWLPRLPCRMTHTVWVILDLSRDGFSHMGNIPGRARADCGELNDVPSDWVSGFESSKSSLRSGDWTIDSSSRRFISFCFCRLGCLNKKMKQ